ncbi:hypothetical protein FQR65_LT13048 [Abscondita terminalis]|nr:hypothetical protein FQR65_LT13048 [Abscondita terminalis]
MCKSPKNALKTMTDKVQINELDAMSTNCTMTGSNNYNLVKRPQMVTNMSPVYSNPSPGYPQSPYSSPASLKSPSPQNFKPPTPQPTFPVMQIIHSSHQLLARPVQSAPQNMIKLKHLNILPKPSASPQPPKPSVSPHIVIPSQQTATIMPTQPLLLNQMPMLAPGVQLILRPQTAKIPHVQTAAPQGLILQPSGQQLLQIPRTAQPMVRVFTNGMPQTQVVTQVASPVITQQTQIMQEQTSFTQAQINNSSPTKKKQKKKPQKLDLANIMKLAKANRAFNRTRNDLKIPKRIGNIHIASVAQPTVSTATPLVQLLNQSFQSGVNSFQTTQPPPPGIPLNSFIAPNITINNGLVVQRNGGFKLALGEDGRLVLQHDPTLNQDLQSQLLLQSIFGLNGLVLQPSLDQVHSQTVQTIQQQSVQTIQQQTVQSQTIQTVQQQTVQPHPIQTIQPQIQAVQPQTVQQTVQQTIQHQTVQSQPLAHTQPMQIVQPQPIHTIQSHNIQQHTIQSQPTVQAVHQSIQSQIQSLLQSQTQVHAQPPPQTQPTQPILKVQPFQKAQPPVQTVHPQPVQTIHHPPHQNDNQTNNPPQTSYVVNLTPEQLELLKRNGQLTVNGQTIFMQRPNKTPETVNDAKKLSPKIKPVYKKVKSPAVKEIKVVNEKVNHVKEAPKSSLVTALQSPPKIMPTQKPPSVVVQPTVQSTVSSQTQTPTPKMPQAKMQSTQTTHTVQTETTPEVDRILGQLLDEPAPVPANTNQRIHTIQLTPQQQQHLKSIQLQIQTLSARLTPGDTEMHTALKLLFAEQQKILASGKLLPPDKVIYQNNQLTIINPTSLGIGVPAKTDAQVTTQPRTSEPNNNQPVVTRAPTPQVPKINPPEVTAPTPVKPPIQQQPQQQQQQPQQQQHNKFIPSFTKAQLLEQQLNTDQNGAIKPDVHTPFRDKADACKRLIRYHCYNQPVLSQKDLNKADEIFELTARHFIDKFSRMVDKYRYLLLKESMRQVQTSELMMLDRMFLAEEQQSLMRLRHEIEECPAEIAQPAQSEQTQEEYDEWACIQRELGCLQQPSDDKQTGSGCQPPKRSASSDSRLETLKKFRVDKHVKRHCDGVNHFSAVVGKAQQQKNALVASAAGGGACIRQQAQQQYGAARNSGAIYSTNLTHQYAASYAPADVYGVQTQQQQSYANNASSVNCVNKSNVQSQQSSEGDSGNNSIDEHVQSAIDSILNLQQNSNSNLDLDEAVSSILS